ncbi:MAG TPA: putative lipid II flippase FtsW [Anaeromyxobacteraceae bacterium]|nr:putative lipid II flippase FtsW [Anaeromyxobacteraceae bacterium]
MTRERAPARPTPVPGVDPWIVGAVLLLTALGAVMVYSASAVTAEARVHDQFWYLKRQLGAAAIGFGLMVAVVRLGYRRLEPLAGPFLLATLAALVLVMIPGVGRSAGGARRWLDLGPVAFQPAEAAKVALVLWLARSLPRQRDKVRLFSVGFLPHALLTGVMVVLVLLERDLGTAVLLVLLLFAMLFAAGARLGFLLGALLAAAPVAWTLVAGTPYRMQRIAAFLDPWQHRDGVGFQIVESLIGIGNGGWLGQGLGEGKGKLFYLPAAHTDFIAAVVAEETGLMGVTLVLGLYGVLVWRGLRAARDAADGFGCFAALGVTTLIAAQALVNLAVVFGLLPTKGLTLPFVSYGGSSLMTLLLAAGVLASVSTGRGGFLRRGPQAVRVAPGTAAGEAARP